MGGLARAGVLVGLLFAACGTPPGPPDMPDGSSGGPGKVVLGTIDGAGNWADLTDGQTVTLAPGAQGGFHIWLLYRLLDISGQVQVQRIADRVGADGHRDRVLTTMGTQSVPAGATVWQTPDPIPNFMCPTPIGINILGQTIEMTVSVTDGAGHPLGEGKARVVPQCPMDAQQSFCQQICTG